LVIVKAEYLRETGSIGVKHGPRVAKSLKDHAYSIQFLYGHNLEHGKFTALMMEKHTDKQIQELVL
jgi:hypothetical protein